MNKFKGCIVEESLTDNRVINNLEIIKVQITPEEDDRWHIYNILVSEKEIDNLHNYLKQGWYMHFWKDNTLIVLFKGKKFILDINNKETWKPAIEYGLSIGIPKEQLDFVMEF